MTLNSPPLSQMGGLVYFSLFWDATRILRVNCAKMAGDRARPRQPA